MITQKDFVGALDKYFHQKWKQNKNKDISKYYSDVSKALFELNANVLNTDEKLSNEEIKILTKFGLEFR